MLLVVHKHKKIELVVTLLESLLSWSEGWRYTKCSWEEKNLLFCEGGLDWSAVRHPRVGGRGGVAAGQVPPPRLLPLHERRHRGLQVTNYQRQEAEFPAKYLGRSRKRIYLWTALVQFGVKVLTIQEADFPAKYLWRKKQKNNLLMDSSGAIWREGVHYILVTKRKGWISTAWTVYWC